MATPQLHDARGHDPMASGGIDLVEESDRGAMRDRIETKLVAYWKVMRKAWPDLDLAATQAIANLKKVFRMLSAISELRSYQSNLTVALGKLGLVAAEGYFTEYSQGF